MAEEIASSLKDKDSSTHSSSDTAKQSNTPISLELGVESIFVQSSRFSREFSSTTSISISSEKEAPSLRCEFRVSHQGLRENRYAVTLHFSATAEQASQTLCHAEISQTGIFVIRCKEDANTQTVIKSLVNGYCPGVLYPFVRQKLQDMLVSANFPAIALPIINFEMEYHKRQQQSPELSVPQNNEVPATIN